MPEMHIQVEPPWLSPLIPARKIHLYTDDYNDSWLPHATGNLHISG